MYISLTREENDRSISAAKKATEWCHRKSVSHLSTHGLHVIDSLTVNLYISQYSMLSISGIK